MQTCLECGNSDMQVKLVDGVPIHECQLCFARFGDRRAVAGLSDAEEAAARGFDARIWPLVRALDALEGLQVRSASPGDARPDSMPFVELVPTSAVALVQLENLAKSLRLGAGGLHGHWTLQVEYQQHLAFVLKPRPAGGEVGVEVRHAMLDLLLLARQFARDPRLRWWRHAEPGAKG